MCISLYLCELICSIRKTTNKPYKKHKPRQTDDTMANMDEKLTKDETVLLALQD